jgi:proline dehydrogenase
MGLSRNFLLWCSEQHWLGEQAMRRHFTRKSLERFMPGEEVGAAVAAADRFREHGITTMLHELGENVTDRDDAANATRGYCELSKRIVVSGLDAQITVKLTHLGLDIDEETAQRNMIDLLEVASRDGIFVWIDMEDSNYTDRTLRLYRRARKTFAGVGVCLQTYLYRTARDLDELLSYGPTIRLVKGAYNEPEAIAYPRRQDVDENFLRLSERLLAQDARQAGAELAAGTHDLELLEQITELAKANDVPVDGFEIQMLYGIQREAQERLAKKGHRMRVLICYGADWYPWFVRRLAERPANVWFLLKNLF